MTDEPLGQGSRVIYVDLDGRRRNALVSIVFTEHENPHLTLLMIKAGGGACFKTFVPHKSTLMNGGAYWEEDPRTINRAIQSKKENT